MDSTFLGLEIGKRSLIAHQKGLNVIGQNLSNADNESYSRQKVSLETMVPLYRPDVTRLDQPGQIGQGIQIAQIRRERDIYLDQRIYSQIGSQEFWKTNVSNLENIENIYNALGSSNLQEKMDLFWAAWQELSNNPSEPAVREDLIQKSLLLTSDFRNKFEQFNQLRREINEKLIDDVKRINDISQQIATLNKAILKSKTIGDNPNDLLDRRDHLIEELSQFGNLKVNLSKDNDEMMVYFDGRVIIQGESTDLLEISDNSVQNGMAQFVWKSDGEQFNTPQPSQTAHQSGSFSANLYARDYLLPREINHLDTLATNIIFNVNDLHRIGFDEDHRPGGNFFTVHPATIEGNGNSDVNADGILESSLIYQIKGGAQLDKNSVIGSFGQITLQSESGEEIIVNYAPNESIKDLLDRINLSESTVSAFLDTQGHLTIKSRSTSPLYPFSLTQISDTGDFLSNISEVLQNPQINFESNVLNAAETLHPKAQFLRTPIKQVSSWITVSPKIVSNSNLIAARTGSDYDFVLGVETPQGKYNGNIAREIAQLRYNDIFFDQDSRFNEFYVGMVSKVGSELALARSEMDEHESIKSSLKEFRQSISGINIDEEIAHMIALQHGYQAGAKVFKVMDEMLETVIRLVG